MSEPFQLLLVESNATVPLVSSNLDFAVLHSLNTVRGISTLAHFTAALLRFSRLCHPRRSNSKSLSLGHRVCFKLILGTISAPTSEKDEQRNVLGSGLCVRETNSSRKGYYLWRACESSSAPRRSAQRWPCNGREPVRERRSVAPRRGLRRQAAHSGALRQPATQTPGI